MAVFTTQPLSRSQTTSQEFKDYGIQNAAPASIGNVRVNIMSTICSPGILFHYALLWAFSGSYLLGKTIPVNATIKTTDTNKVTDKLFENPPVVVTFAGRRNETQETKLAELSFLPQSANRYSFYKGPANDTAIRALVAMGADTECYAPYGACNLAGIFALSIFNRLLTASLGFVSLWTNDGKLGLPEENVSGATWNKDFKITSKNDLPEKGVFFPYFDGLLLPDKAETPRIFIGIFSRALGRTPDELKSACGLISRGWPSVSTTATGLALSHLVFIMDLSIKAGCGMRPIFLEREYKGCVLLGTGFGLTIDNVIHTSYGKDAMIAELSLISRHEVNLAALAALLSTIKPIGEDKNEAVLPENISSGRSLHYYIKERNFETAQQTEIRELVQGLRFEETFWEVTDRRRVATAVTTILKGTWLPEAAPFCYKSAALFTKEPILSTCAAFGLKAPSLLGIGNNAALSISKNGKFYTDFKAASIRGTPIFAKPVQQAYEDWKQLKKSKVITLKHGGNDKNGKAKIFQMTMMVPDDTPEYRHIINGLTQMLEDDKKKRKRAGDEEEEEPTRKKATTTQVGKARETGDEYLAVLGLQPDQQEIEEEEMNMDW